MRHPAERDRIAGVLLATAAGDALGAGYEFGPPLADDAVVEMSGGGSFGWGPGEWTDDTSMAIAIAELAAAGRDLRDASTQDALVRRWIGWSRGAKDVGIQTRQVLSVPSPSAATVAAAAQDLHARTGRTGGNGSLMRTAPVALAFLDDAEALVAAATSVSTLTHPDRDAGEACVLWCLAIRRAVHTATLDVRVGLSALPHDRAEIWRERIEIAEARRPRDFEHNGWVVEAFQAAWSAIAGTAAPAGPEHLQRALEAAVRGGRDTDTVAAIAGGLLGAAYGASAVPARWRRMLKGWPGLVAHDLVQLGLRAADPAAAWPAVVDYRSYAPVQPVRHPWDDGVWLGGAVDLPTVPAGVDAVVSLCRVGADQIRDVPDADRVEVWLVDAEDLENANPQLAFVVADAVSAVRELRARGRIVLLHCVAAETRTPLVAAAYGAAVRGTALDEALDAVAAVLPSTRVSRVRTALHVIATQ